MAYLFSLSCVSKTAQNAVTHCETRIFPDSCRAVIIDSNIYIWQYLQRQEWVLSSCAVCTSDAMADLHPAIMVAIIVAIIVANPAIMQRSCSDHAGSRSGWYATQIRAGAKEEDHEPNTKPKPSRRRSGRHPRLPP